MGSTGTLPSWYTETTMPEKVVLVLDDETRIKGHVESFDPHASLVKVREVDGTGLFVELHHVAPQEVLVAFFVHDLAIWGKGPADPDAAPAEEPEPLSSDERRVILTFPWGENFRGVIRPLDPSNLWYCLRPSASDRAPNIRHALVARRAIARIRPAE